LTTNGGALQDLNYNFGHLGNVSDISGAVSGIKGTAILGE